VQRSSLIEGYRRTGDRHIADPILACMLAKIEGDAVQRALELAGVQFIDADDSAARVCACGGTEL
jgi:hypothetical protein